MILLETIADFVYNTFSRALSGGSSGDCFEELTGACCCAPEERI